MRLPCRRRGGAATGSAATRGAALIGRCQIREIRRKAIRFGNRIAGVEKRAIRLRGGDPHRSVSGAAVRLLARFT